MFTKNSACPVTQKQDSSHNIRWRVGQIKRVIVNDIGGHEFIDVSLLPGINLITGGNGSGKSSLVSAIALLCGWSGRKAGKDTNLNKYIRIGANKGSVRVHFANNNCEFQKGYFYDIYGDEIIIERIVYLKGTSNYTFKGSKTNSPIHKFSNAKNHLSKFREYANIIINNPVTFLTQADAKYLIREQSSPKSLYDFFQRAHLFDCCWKHLADEQRYIESAEIISNSLSNELKQLESELEECKKINERIQLYNKLQKLQKNLECINIVATIQNLSWSINTILTQLEELNKAKPEQEIDELNIRIHKSDKEISTSQSELNDLRSEHEFNINEHKRLTIELEQARDQLISYSKQMEEIKSSISSMEKEIEFEGNNFHMNIEQKNFGNKEELLEEIKNCKERLNQLILRKENLILQSVNKKNKISEIFERIKQEEAEINFISDERLEFEQKLDEVKSILNADNKSLEQNELNQIKNSESVGNGKITDLGSNKYNSKGKGSLALMYSQLYNFFTDEDFKIIFGYSKTVHNKIIIQLEESNNKATIIGPIALHIFFKPDIQNNEKILNLIDEIIGGRLEDHDIVSGYKIRRNYKYWLVGNSKIRKELISLFEDNGISFDPSLIYIRSLFSQKHELSGLRNRFPNVGLAVVDLINIENDEVFNFLVDNFQIETTFIFLNDHEMELIYDYNFNIRRAHCLANYSFKYRRGGMVVTPEISIPKRHTTSKIVIRRSSDISQLRVYESDLCSTQSRKQICKLTEKFEMKNLLKLSILENETKKKEMKRKIIVIEENIKELKLSISNNNNKVVQLHEELKNYEAELESITKEEHSTELKIGELEIDIMKFYRDKNRGNNASEINNLKSKLDELNQLLIGIQEKNNCEEKLKNFKEAELEKLKATICNERELIRLKEENLKRLKLDQNSLLNEKPKIKKKINQTADKINQLNTEINSKKDELARIRAKYPTLSNEFCVNESSNSEPSILINNELFSTLEYFNWNFNISKGVIRPLPDYSTIEIWKSKISRQIDSVFLEIIEQSKNVGFDTVQKNCSDKLNKILTSINEKFRKYNEKSNEFQEENKLLKKNKFNLDKRVQLLQKNHIRCGKNVNTQFKHYFTIFWSNTMRPHLKFDHDRSILNIYVIPDTATLKRPKQFKNILSEKDPILNKDQNFDFVNREIQSLSGGESSSIGISLLLALSQNNPSPFHLFDEPDVYMDDIRRMTTIQSLIEFERLCSKGEVAYNRQILFITPHDEIVPFIKEYYVDLIHVIQLIKKQDYNS